MPVIRNLIGNPSGENNGTYNSSGGFGIYPLGAGATVSRDNTQAYVGTYSAKVVTTGAGANEGVRFWSEWGLGITGPAKSYVAQAHILVPSGTPALEFDFYVQYTDFSFVGTSVLFNGSNAWTYKETASPTASNPAKTLDQIFVDIRTQGTTATTFYVDAVMAHEGDAPVPYFDGDTTDTALFRFDWAGTANASESTRTSLGLSASGKIRRTGFELRPGY